MKKSARRLSKRHIHTRSHKKRQNWIMKNRYLIIGIFCLLMVVLGVSNYLRHGLVLAVTTGPSAGGTTISSKTTQPSAPTVHLSSSCLSQSASSDVFSVHWSSGQGVQYVDVGLDSSFNAYYNANVKSVRVTSISGPENFYPYKGVEGSLKIVPNKTYYVRVYNGVHSNSTTFSFKKCSTSGAKPTPTPKPKTDPKLQALGCVSNVYTYSYQFDKYGGPPNENLQNGTLTLTVGVCGNEYKRQLTRTHAIYIAREDAYITIKKDPNDPYENDYSCKYYLSDTNGNSIEQPGAQYFLDEVSPDNSRSHLESAGPYYYPVDGYTHEIPFYPNSLVYLKNSTCPGHIAGGGVSRDVSSDTVKKVDNNAVVQAFVGFHLIFNGKDLGDTFSHGPRLTLK